MLNGAAAWWMFAGYRTKRASHLSARLGLVTIRTFVKSKLAADKDLPFSSAVRVGDTLYIAGTTADPKNLAAALTPEQEATERMEQLKKRKRAE